MTIDTFQPIIDQVVGVLAIFIAGLVATALVELRKHVLAYIAAHTTEKNRKILYQFAGEAYAFIAQKYKLLGGPAKLQYAVKYVQDVLAKKRINITDDEIKAAIEKIRLEYKAGISATVVMTPDPVVSAPAIPAPTTAQILASVGQALIGASGSVADVAPVAETPSVDAPAEPTLAEPTNS